MWGLQSLCEYLISTGQIVDKEVCRVIFRTIRIRGIWYHRAWTRYWMPIICVFSFIAWWAAGPWPFRGGVQRGGRDAVPSFADAEGVALRVCAGGDIEPAPGAAHPRGPGLPLSGGQRAAGLLGAERVPAAAWACDQRLLHPGGGDGARAGPAAAGHGGHLRDPDQGVGVAGQGGEDRARRAGAYSAEGAALAAGLRRGRSQRERRKRCR